MKRVRVEKEPALHTSTCKHLNPIKKRGQLKCSLCLFQSNIKYVFLVILVIFWPLNHVFLAVCLSLVISRVKPCLQCESQIFNKIGELLEALRST